MDLEHKNLSVSGGLTETTDDGIVEALVSVTGVLDNVKDIIEPGAYQKTLKERTAKGVWSHDWNTPVSKVKAIEELMPGDPRLPAKLANGDPWPAESGALYVKAQFNLETQRGREAFSDVKFFEDQCEWSIGYKVPKGKATVDEKTGIRHIKELDLFEFSPVLFGAASNARSLMRAAKSLYETDAEFLQEVKELTHVEFVESSLEHKEEQQGAEELEEKESMSEKRMLPVEVSLTAESMAQIKALHDQLGAVLEIISNPPKQEVIFGETKTIGEAIDDLDDDNRFDTLREKVALLQKSIDDEDRTLIKSHANSVLDDVTIFLSSDTNQEKELKSLVAAIGDAIKDLKDEEPEPINDEKSEATTEEVKTITIPLDEWEKFLNL